MEILVIGAGVIGTTYGWLLSGAGEKVTHVVKPKKRAYLERAGFLIRYTDLRQSPKAQDQITYRPPLVDAIPKGSRYDLVLVSVPNRRLADVLAAVRKGAGDADVLLFQDLWNGYGSNGNGLRTSRCFFGLPQISGSYESNVIESVICNERTLLGEADGSSTPRLERAAAAFEKAGLDPEVQGDIVERLSLHYVQQAAFAGALIAAGSPAEMLCRTDLLRRALLAYREGVEVCRAHGISPENATLMPPIFLHAPVFLLVPLFRRTFGDEACLILEGNYRHRREDLVAAYFDVLSKGEERGLPMPYWRSFRPEVETWKVHKLQDRSVNRAGSTL